ncbi:hypothetical protein EMPS_04474 [Entomortierella parvispora]|uniref:SUN domain-containing protein n=1 Tax=Entomortierella parvispora TaxID=205924 RepID=A0A9P3H8Q5_9FUNG|nr:hypothetical protein EMPS_04474 [Entomortierella parvispora]
MNTASSPRTRQAHPTSPRLSSSETLLLPGVIGTTVEGPRTPKRTPSRGNTSQFMSPRLPLRPLGQSGHSPRPSNYMDGVVDVLPESGDRGASPSITSARWRMKYRPRDTPLSTEKIPRKLYFSSEDERDEDESSWAGRATPTRSHSGFINLVLESDSLQDEGAEPAEVEEVFPETDVLDQDQDQDQEEPELTQAELDAEERERIRESTQLGFIKRITRSLKNGWSTPRKDGAASESDGEESDSAMSASSARARATQDLYFRQRQARLPRIPPLRTQFTGNSLQREAPKTHERYGTQTLRNFDSGVAMSMSQDGYNDKMEDPFQDDLHVETDLENLDRENQPEDEYRPTERHSTPTRSSTYLREDPEYPELDLESESDYESADVDILDQEDERYYPSFSPSPMEEFQQVESKSRRQRRSTKRIYPWHVLWRNLVYYTQKGMDLYNAIAIASMSFLWLLWTCIRLSLTWPWTQRHKVHQLSREWYEAGVAVGLLNPGTLFGVVLLASLIMYSQPDEQISHDPSSSWNGRTGPDESMLNHTRTSRPNFITSSLSRAWEGIAWRANSQGDNKEESKVSWNDWVPRLPTLDLWIPFKNHRGTPRIELPEGDIQSLEELEERIAWIQNTLVDLRRTDSKLADGFKGLEDSVLEKLNTKGGQMHDLERRFEGFEQTIAEKEKEVQSLENRFRSAIAQKEKEIAELRGLEHRVNSNLAKPLEDLQHYLESKLRETDTKVEDMSVWIEGFEHKLQRVSDDVTSLKKYIADGRWIELKVLEVFRDQIPRYLVVSKDPESGKLSIPASFWDSARELFMTSDQVQKTIDDKLSRLGMESSHDASDGTESNPSKWGWGSKASKDSKKVTRSMSWDEFLNENRIPISNYVDGRATIVSRTVFLNMVKTEATQIWKSLEKNVVALLEKQGKLKGRAPFHHGGAGGNPSTGVFDHNTELSDVERDLVNSLIDEALEKYSADVLAKPDYALYSAGGRIIPRLTSPNYHHVVKPTLFGRLGARFLFPLPRREKPAEKAIEPDIHAGECWAMEGHEGQLAVRLARKIVVTEVTIEHADPSVLLDSGSAAREIEVWSLTTDADSAPTSPLHPSSTVKDKSKDNSADQDILGETPSVAPTASEAKEFGSWWREGAPWPGARLLTTIVYDASAGVSNNRTPHSSGNVGDIETELKADLKHAKTRQTFSIPLSKQTEPSQGIVFRIKSNWGNPAYTCVYRVRVHGHER